MPHFVIARILQGIGGAMMTPVGRLVLLRSIDKSELVNAMTWLTMPALIGPMVGPPLGGFITTYFSWHWIFLINLPIGLLGIFLAMRYIDPIRSEAPSASISTGWCWPASGWPASPSAFRSPASICCRGRSSRAWSRWASIR